ncbi:MAG: DUF4085 family protein [Bacillota bacterium]
MNYFTKEWYELCQKTSAHLLLEEEEEAESFSEEYFQQLYNQKLMEWLVLQEEVASCTFDDIYPAEMSPDFFNEEMSEEEISVLRASYQKEREAAKETYIPPEPFDREKASKQFQEAFIYNQEHIKNLLPEEILKKIADIRVFILDKASRQVIDDVNGFCEDNEKIVKRTIKEYEKYYKKALESFDRSIVEKINFHDCTIIEVKQTEQFLTVLFNNSGGFTDISEMQFENYKIIKQEALLQNSWWLYDEIYKVNGKYELHVLLQNENMDLVEFIVSAEHISFKHNPENED